MLEPVYVVAVTIQYSVATNSPLMNQRTVFTCILSLIIVHVAVFRFLPSTGFDIDPAKSDPDEDMNAIIFESHGSSDVLKYTKIARPLRDGNKILIQVHAASVNPCDYKWRRNEVPSFLVPLPKVPGGDIAGVVIDAPDKSKFKAGDRVAAMVPLVGSRWGGYSEYYAAKEEFVSLIAENISFVQAASLPLVALTTLKGLEDIESPSEKSILIHAGSGGVGTFAVQWAKKVLKMKTVAVTCSSRNREVLLGLGADVVVDYRTEDFTSMIRNYDIVFDPMSYHYEQASLQPGVLAPGGSYINIVSSDFQLSSSGTEVANDVWTFLNPSVFAARRWLDPAAISYKTVLVAPHGRRLQIVMNEVAQGRVHPVIDSEFTLAQAAEAQEYLAKGHAVGKVVLRMDYSPP